MVPTPSRQTSLPAELARSLPTFFAPSASEFLGFICLEPTRSLSASYFPLTQPAIPIYMSFGKWVPIFHPGLACAACTFRWHWNRVIEIQSSSEGLMGRTPNVPNRFPAVSGNAVSPRSAMVKSGFSGSWWDLLLVRAFVVVLAVVACYYFRPFGLARVAAAAAGFVFAVLVILAEMRLRSASLRRLLGAAAVALLGTLRALPINP